MCNFPVLLFRKALNEVKKLISPKGFESITIRLNVTASSYFLDSRRWKCIRELRLSDLLGISVFWVDLFTVGCLMKSSELYFWERFLKSAVDLFSSFLRKGFGYCRLPTFALTESLAQSKEGLTCYVTPITHWRILSTFARYEQILKIFKAEHAVTSLKSIENKLLIMILTDWHAGELSATASLGRTSLRDMRGIWRGRIHE